MYIYLFIHLFIYIYIYIDFSPLFFYLFLSVLFTPSFFFTVVRLKISLLPSMIDNTVRNPEPLTGETIVLVSA